MVATVSEETDDEISMDPIVSAALAKGAGKAADEGATLMSRVLGPSADEIGQALARYTSFRLENVGRITEKARAKSRADDTTGHISPRVAHKVLEDGSFCDGELMAEYFGGLLAASRTFDGRDDRAVSWTALVAQMSSLQVRAHFLLYREWVTRLSDSPNLQLHSVTGRTRATMYAELNEFGGALVPDFGRSEKASALYHAIEGNARLGLIGDFWYGTADRPEGHDAPWSEVLKVRPTASGFELFGWAQGVPDVRPDEVVQHPDTTTVDVVRLHHIALPYLDRDWTA